MNRQDLAIVAAFALIIFLAEWIGYFAYRIDKLDERLSNIELAKP